MVCINPDFFENHKPNYQLDLIPNGVDNEAFMPSRKPTHQHWGGDNAYKTVLMVSALIPSKRVVEGIQAASNIENINFLVAGNGPLRDTIDQLGQKRFGERFQRIEVPRIQMPDIYRSADVTLHM
ncbi:MAG: hypothetical protein ACK53L_14250, partial [Pirellulaceae bacterium]